jgi:hypothetical protein
MSRAWFAVVGETGERAYCVGANQAGITVGVSGARSPCLHTDSGSGGETDCSANGCQKAPPRRSAGNGDGQAIDGMSGHPGTFLSHESYNRTCRLGQET